MDMASNDIRLETKSGQFIAMNLHSCEKEIFVAADLVLIENFATKNIDDDISIAYNKCCVI